MKVSRVKLIRSILVFEVTRFGICRSLLSNNPERTKITESAKSSDNDEHFPTLPCTSFHTSRPCPFLTFSTPTEIVILPSKTHITYASEYNAHPQRIRTRVPVYRVSVRRRIRMLASCIRVHARAFVCRAVHTLPPGTTTHHAAVRHPRGKRTRGSECFAALRDLPPAPPTLVRSISPENPNILSGLSTLCLIQEMPERKANQLSSWELVRNSGQEAERERWRA